MFDVYSQLLEEAPGSPNSPRFEVLSSRAPLLAPGGFENAATAVGHFDPNFNIDIDNMHNFHSLAAPFALGATLAALAAFTPAGPQGAALAQLAETGVETTSVVELASTQAAPAAPGQLQISADAELLAQAPIEEFGLPDPIYFFKTGCPDLLQLKNWTECTLYFITFLDCDGDGVVDSFNEHFALPGWTLEIKPEPECDILYWGLFDIIPWGGCEPGWVQDGAFPCLVHFI